MTSFGKAGVAVCFALAASSQVGAYVWRNVDFSSVGSWSVVSNTSGATPVIAKTEDELTNTEPWISDGVRAKWDTLNTTTIQRKNHVLAAMLDGAAANQNAIFKDTNWSDTVNSARQWKVTFNARFIAEDMADMASLRAKIEFKYNNATQLTLQLTGSGATSQILDRTYIHSWSDTPETGNLWTMTITLSRIAAGKPVMIMIDNIHITEDHAVEGIVNLADFVGVPRGIPFTVKVMDMTTILETLNLTLDESGYYCANLMTTGTRDFVGKGDRWLALRKTALLVSADRTTINWAQDVLGDSTGDNVVDLRDLNAELIAFDTSPGMDPTDLDGSGMVDIKDFNTTLVNFGMSGDT